MNVPDVPDMPHNVKNCLSSNTAAPGCWDHSTFGWIYMKVSKVMGVPPISIAGWFIIMQNPV